MKHWETHPEYVEGCQPCKWATVRTSTERFTRQRKGEGPGAQADMNDREYVRKMYEDRRAQGLPDPIPDNAKAAALAPAAGPVRDKKYKEANNGL